MDVAIDAAGAGGARPYTYHLPPSLATVELGEAVLVEYGRRRSLGIVMGDAAAAPDRATKPVLERVRTEGPLLSPDSIGLARWISEHYLAPPALVIRAMLPPGMLERLELVAWLVDPGERPGVGGDGVSMVADRPEDAPADAALLQQLESGPRRVRELGRAEGRAALMRRLRALQDDGRVRLEWTLTAAGGGPRRERWLRLTGEGAAALAPEGAAARPRLGLRQRAILEALAAGPIDGLAAAPLGEEHGAAAVASLGRRGLVEFEVRERPRRPLEARPPGARGGRPGGTSLTATQRAAVAAIDDARRRGDSTPMLIDGVTGGGKTAIYVEAIASALADGRSALLLVPETALALPLVDRLRVDLAVPVALMHSALSDGERADEWRRIRSGEVRVVVGTRTAVLAPIASVGLVIVDEEHDPAYKSDRTPRYQARDTALELGRRAGATVVLGSATPAVETLGRTRTGVYRRIELVERASGHPPEIEVVDLRAELAAGNRGLLSASLLLALRRLDVPAGERAILVINRRGTASVVVCRDCGMVQGCPECARPLVFHQVGMSLRCHHCGLGVPAATRCPACGSPRIRYLGGGTERVEREVRERVPDLRVARLDRDVAERRGEATRILDAFRDGHLDVLVGTSLVAKGLDVPEVTLVGMVSADIALNLPDERAAERTYQLLVQAIGRAGRGARPGRAIIQTYQPEHPVIVAVARRDPAAFYDAELALRARFGSPPFGRLVKLTCGDVDAGAAEREATRLATALRERAVSRGLRVSVVGPAPAYVARRAGRWRWNVVLRGDDPVGLLDGGLGAPWSVDVDPESLL